jgi:hypothetical protein
MLWRCRRGRRKKGEPSAKQAAGGECHQEHKKKQQQQPVVKEKMKKGGEPAEVAEGREVKKNHHKDSPILVHQFPFHSRPGLL